MFSKFAPVNPLRTESGALAALVPIFGEQKSMPMPLASGQPLNNFQVVFAQTSFSLAASLGISQIFQGSFTGNESAFFYDCVVYHDEASKAPGQGDVILATRWGVGLRIALRVTNLQAKANLSFAVISASVEAGYATAEYDIQGFGLGAAGLNLVNSKIQTLGDFKYKTYFKMNTEIIPEVSDYINKNVGAMKPEPIAVTLAPDAANTPVSEARAIYFATRWVSERKPLSDALQLPQAVGFKNLVQLVYNRYMPGNGPTTVPSKDAEHAAEDWLQTKF